MNMRCCLLAMLLLTVAGCGSSKAPPEAATETTLASATAEAPPTRLDAKHLPNAIRVNSKVISGGLPEGDAAFAELAALGVKTVISVDGAKPDVETAQRHGLRYVHLPHGYDGIAESRGRELAKAVQELPGPIYIHCHHGKHRSPAAAGVACVLAGMATPQTAHGLLKLAGTSPNYRGLYRSVERAQPLPPQELAALQVEFQPIAKIPPLADAMVAIEHTFDRLKQIEAAGWKAPLDHPDLEAAHEALLLREHYTELLRTDEVSRQPDAFRALLSESETAAGELETLLLAQNATPSDRAAAASQAMERLTQGCAGCHKQFRDVPLDEK